MLLTAILNCWSTKKKNLKRKKRSISHRRNLRLESKWRFGISRANHSKLKDTKDLSTGLASPSIWQSTETRLAVMNIHC